MNNASLPKSRAYLGRFIAEVKTESPFGFRSELSWDQLFQIANSYGDALSIHTDTRWGGSFELLKKARSLTSKPILAKGIHASDDEIRRALDCGADAVLVVGRLPDANLIKHCWIEPLEFSELAGIPQGSLVVWNSRDLNTGASKKVQWSAVRQAWTGTICQASEIGSAKDIHPDADCFLVGQNLIEVTRELIFSERTRLARNVGEIKARPHVPVSPPKNAFYH